MKKYDAKLWAVVVVLAGACGDEHYSDVPIVPGQISAHLSGDGMPSDEREKAYQHDELYLDIDPVGRLLGFSTHQWNFEPKGRSYDLELEFASTQGSGPSELVSASVCIATCTDKPRRDGCAGPCFSHLQSGTVEVKRVSKDGESFDVVFAFDVADSEGHVIHVRDGKARTHD